MTPNKSQIKARIEELEVMLADATPEQIAKSRRMESQRGLQRDSGSRKLEPEDNIPGPHPFLAYTYKLGGFIGNAGLSYRGRNTRGDRPC
mgnify:CR=1 FL=1